MLSMGDTLVPLIFMSNGKHLWNIAGDKKAWPVSMKIENLLPEISQTASMRSVKMVPLILIMIKNRNIPQKRLDEQRQTNQEVLNGVLQRVLQALTSKQHPSTQSGYYNVLCVDRNFRCCKQDSSALCADCLE
jgi:hypothetical protein